MPENNPTKDTKQLRNSLLLDEVFKMGVYFGDKILHLCAGYRENCLMSSINIKKIFEMELNTEKPEYSWEPYDLDYTGVDIDQVKMSELEKFNDEHKLIRDLRTSNSTAQDFLDNTENIYDWVLITGLFDDELYQEKQFHFVNEILKKSLTICKEGVLFSFDGSKSKNQDYTSSQMNAFVYSIYPSWKISKINEHDYLFCINKYYHSITQ